MKISHIFYPVSPISSSSCPQSSSSSSSYSFDLSFSQPSTFINPRYTRPSWIQAEQFETLHANTYVHNQPNHFFETSSEVPLDVISRTLVDEVQGDLCYISNYDDNVTTNNVVLCESYSLDSLWNELENSETMPANSSPVTINGEEKKMVAKKRGNPWTKDEHKLFILGLKKYGKGAWKNISRDFVTTRSGIQVASHAQKFFKRHGSITQRKRSSIHDITQVDDDFIVDLVGKGVLSPDEALALHTPDLESHTQAEKHDVQMTSNVSDQS